MRVLVLCYSVSVSLCSAFFLVQLLFISVNFQHRYYYCLFVAVAGTSANRLAGKTTLIIFFALNGFLYKDEAKLKS